MAINATVDRQIYFNGVNIDQLNSLIDTSTVNPDSAEIRLGIRNKWLNGSYSRSNLLDIQQGRKISNRVKRDFSLDADKPPLLAGGDKAPCPVEFVLHSLAACLTTTLVYHAAIRGIAVDSCESNIEGELDLRGLLGIASNVRKGYQNIRVVMRIDSETDEETLKELALFSPVYDIVSRSLPVDLRIEKL